jgi:hypothetical protein
MQFFGSFGKSNFEKISRTFFNDPALPFASILSAEAVVAVFQKYDGCFGGVFFSVSLVLWAFLSQVLSDGKERSCFAAVSRIAHYFMQRGERGPDTDTGNYCRARRHLPAQALQELAETVSRDIETAAPQEWLWHEGQLHVKLVDGFTVTMSDTSENQAKFPQSDPNRHGLSFPIMRVCVIVSMATAMIIDAAFGAYQGKETGESALLRKLLDSFKTGDVTVFDRYYCSYMMLALLTLQGVHVCTRINATRRLELKKSRRLGKNDHLVTWKRPTRPEWMSEEDYEKIPETMTFRVISYSIACRGQRTETVTIVTDLLDADEYSKEDIIELYGYRWNVELDIRHIKQTLNLVHLRCKTPEMIEREFWVTILAYNLVRKVMCQAAAFSGVLPRRLSFTQTCVHLLTMWMTTAQQDFGTEQRKQILLFLSKLILPDRKGRWEPRVIKRRKNKYPYRTKPRNWLKNNNNDNNNNNNNDNNNVNDKK